MSGYFKFPSPDKFDCQILPEEEVRDWIKKCEGRHIQQVCFSTYHDAFTQVCFTERKIRTSLQLKERK